MPRATPPIDDIAVRVLRIPTDAPEADGTIAWNETTMVLVTLAAGGEHGIGFTYGSAAAAQVVEGALAGVVRGRSAMDIPALWTAMVDSVRNLGWRGVCAHAISAVDVALWDLKAKLVGLPLCDLLGMTRSEVPIYGSGGFTSYSMERLQQQLAGWVNDDGCRFVKMKIGSDPDQDLARVEAARRAVGAAALFVDANGAYSRKQALAFAQEFSADGVIWFEEPVSSDDLEGLRLLRDSAPAGMEIAAGEYGYDPFYFRRMLEAGAVDVLQADATRCGGITGFLKAAAIAEAFSIPLSAHTAPAVHLHAACAVAHLRHLEWFYDHVRIEQAVFDGAPVARNGVIAPDRTRPGLGLTFKQADAERLAA
jgi:L-alanine-DL-glutamate epimerase-like enolase superfamily enzyme